MEKHVIIFSFTKERCIHYSYYTLRVRQRERECGLHACAFLARTQSKASFREEKKVVFDSKEKQIQNEKDRENKTRDSIRNFLHRVFIRTMLTVWSKKKLYKIPRTSRAYGREKPSLIFFHSCVCLCSSFVHINIINNIRAERYQFHINIHKS